MDTAPAGPAAAASTPSDPSPAAPSAARRPHRLTAHGDERVDDWYWLRDRHDPAVLAHLSAENTFTDALLAPAERLREQLFEEIRGHVAETDVEVPARDGRWWYYSRTEEGRAYPVHCRMAAEDGAPTPPEITGAQPGEQILLDVDAEAEGHGYFRVGWLLVSPDHRLLAWAVDTTGDERHVLRVRDLDSGTDLPDEVADVSYGAAWAADGRTLFYVRPDAAVRPYQLWRHRVGAGTPDVLIQQEDDERYSLAVRASKDRRLLLTSVASELTSEWSWLPADDPEGRWRVVQPRREGVEYSVEHHDGRFLIVTNDGAENFRLVQTPVDRCPAADWQPVIPADPAVRLLGVEVFATFLLLYERSGGLTRLRCLDLASGELHELAGPDGPGTVRPVWTPEYASPLARYSWTSLVTPPTVADYHPAARRVTVRKQQPVHGYDPQQYRTERAWAQAADGVAVPISLAYRADLDRSRPAPCVLYGYGAYELSSDPVFAESRLPLLDRGYVWAVAHIRGGGEFGRRWYEDGKLLSKRNTFTDFLACARQLLDDGWTAADRLVARGGSAGGLLMGAVANLAPELFAGIVAHVPFVDVLTTMLDASLPLTVPEWEEWGNPVADPQVYRYMRSYSPYDNVAAAGYPPMLVLAGLNDSRVSYWEPAKWVQRLRAGSTSGRHVLLRTEMDSGHGGPSGRYDAWRREAFVLAWILAVCGSAGPELADRVRGGPATGA